MSKKPWLLISSILLLGAGCSPASHETQVVSMPVPSPGYSPAFTEKSSGPCNDYSLDDREKIKKNELWIYHETFSGMQHGPTIHHLCRGKNELLYTEMDYDSQEHKFDPIQTGRLKAYNKSDAFKFTVSSWEPLLSLLDAKEQPDPTLIWLSINGEKTVSFNERTGEFKSQGR